jgi:Spy/CpxP family protein refolding chaperone
MWQGDTAMRAGNVAHARRMCYYLRQPDQPLFSKTNNRKESPMRTLVLVLALAVAFSAQSATAQTAAEKVKAEFAKIQERLKLTDDQKTQLKKLLAEEVNKLDAIYKEYEPKEDAVVKEYKSKMRAVLTPEQQAEWDKIKKEYSDKLKQKADEKEKKTK